MKPVTCFRVALSLCGVLAAGEAARAQSDSTLPSLEAVSPLKDQELADRARDLRQASIDQPATLPDTLEGDAAPVLPHDLLVTFRHGSAKLTPSATRQLDSFGRALPQSEKSELRLRVAGFGDGAGPRETDRDLASRRAHIVATYIGREAGLAGDQIEIAGLPGHMQTVSLSIIEP